MAMVVGNYKTTNQFGNRPEGNFSGSIPFATNSVDRNSVHAVSSRHVANESGVSETLKTGFASRILHFLSTLDEFRKLPSNWDSYGAKPIEVSAHRSAVSFLVNLASKDQDLVTNRLEVYPVPTGGIQFEWETDNGQTEVEFEINPQGKVHLLICRDDEFIEPDRNHPYSVDDALAYLNDYSI